MRYLKRPECECGSADVDPDDTTGLCGDCYEEQYCLECSEPFNDVGNCGNCHCCQCSEGEDLT